MQITRETDYAIRCVYYLALKKGDTVMVDEVSREMQVPKSFLAKILQRLSKASLVKSYRGVKGGFELARNPSEISLLDVIEAIQGKVAVNVCALNQKACDRSATCAIHPVWVEVRGELERMLRARSFADLIAV
jgi:Rrf2 family protein